MGSLLRDDPVPVNPVFQATGYDQLDTGYALDATAAEAWASGPTASLNRLSEINQSDNGTRFGFRGLGVRPPESPILDPEQANQQFGIKGELSWDKPVRQQTAKLQSQFAMDRLERADQLQRAETGFIAGAARLTTGLAVSALDPLNVAASFVPVVGEARFASLVGKFGLTGARIARGVAEGAVGQALIEPIQIADANAEQRDYSAWNAVTNVAMGAALGGALHVGAGFIKDRLIGVPDFTPPDQHATALRGAVSALADDRPVRIAEYLRFQEMVGRRADLLSGTSLTQPIDETAVQAGLPAEPRALSEQPLTPGQAVDLDLPTLREDGTPGTFPADTLGFRSEIERLQNAASAEGRQIELRQMATGEHALVEPAKLEVVDQFPDEATARANIKRMAPADREGLQTVPFTRVDGTEGSAIVRGLTDRQARAVRENPGLLDAAIQTPETLKGLIGADQTPQQFTPEMVTQAWRDMIQTQRGTYEPQPQEVREAAEVTAQTPRYNKPIASDDPIKDLEAELTDLDQLVTVARAAGKLTAEHEAVLAQADAMVNQAEQRGAGYAAAVSCIVRGL